MRTRTLSRQAALQYLYEADLVGGDEAEPLDAFLDRQLARPEARTYARELAEGVLARLSEIDAEISGACDNWTLDRMSTVDRNVLRLGTYELVYGKDIPPKVAINEAIELARVFSTEDAGAFVNGILDRVLQGSSTAGTKGMEEDRGDTEAQRTPGGERLSP